MSECYKYGTVLDADVNGAMNILNSFKNEAFTVPHNTKNQNLIDFV
jgi:transposase